MQCLLTVLGLLYTPFYMKKSLETLSILGNFSLNVGGTEATMVLSFSNHLTQEAMGNTGLTHVGKVSKVSQSCPTLCDPTDCSLPGSSIHGIFQARVLEWVAIAFSDNTMLLLLLLSRFSRVRLCATPQTAAHQAPLSWDSSGKNTGVGCHFLLQCMNVKSESEVAQSCPTLRDPMDCSLPGSSAHEIFQATVLEWVTL